MLNWIDLYQEEFALQYKMNKPLQGADEFFLKMVEVCKFDSTPAVWCTLAAILLLCPSRLLKAGNNNEPESVCQLCLKFCRNLLLAY